MSDEKLDLILTVVSGIKLKVDSLDSKVDKLETRFDTFEAEFKKFRAQVIESFAAMQSRFAVLEKQMFAIGVEVKEEIKTEIKAVGENIDRLEKEILFARADSVDNRVKMRELETRLSRLENQVGLAV